MGTKEAIFSRGVKLVLTRLSVLVLYILCCALYSSPPVKAQIQLKNKDKKGIKNRSLLLVKEYQNLLNNISSTAMYPDEVQIIIDNSFQASGSRIFENKDIIVEDDLMPKDLKSQINNPPKNLTIKAYLKKFDLLYLDTEKPSVEFKNIVVSDVQKREYIYTQVTFDCLFKSKNKINPKQPYTPTKRVVEIRAFRENNRWNALITSIAFANSKRQSASFSTVSKTTKNETTVKKEEIIPSPKEDWNAVVDLKNLYKEKPIDFYDLSIFKRKKDLKKQTIGLMKFETKMKHLVAVDSLKKADNISKIYYNDRFQLQKSFVDKSAIEFEKVQYEAYIGLCWRITILLRLKRYREVIELSDIALKYKRKNERVIYQRALANYELGKYDQAVNNLILVKSLGSHQLNVYLLLANVYKAQGRYVDSKKTLFQYISQFGLNGEVCYALGEVYEIEKNDDQALDYFTRSFEEDNTLIKSIFRVAKILVRRKEYKGAIDFLEFQSSENPTIMNHRYYQLLGRSYLNERNYDVALEFLSKARLLKNNDALVLVDLAKLHFIKGKDELGYKYLTEALKTGKISKRDLDVLKFPSNIRRNSKYKLLLKTYLP